MNKRALISRVQEKMREGNIRKPISYPKQTFTISDDDGNSKIFTVKKTDRNVPYTTADIETILDLASEVVRDSLKVGEPVTIHGFGTFDVKYRAERSTRLPHKDGHVVVPERYVPRFIFGNELRTAALIYEQALKEGRVEPRKSIKDAPDEGQDEGW